jgi:hypothetical protein
VSLDQEVHVIGLHGEVNHTKLRIGAASETPPKLQKNELAAKARKASHGAQRHMHRVPRAVHWSRNVRHTGAQSRRFATGARAAPPPRSKDEHLLRRVSVPMRSFTLRGPLGGWMYDHLDSAIILLTRYEFKPNVHRRE